MLVLEAQQKSTLDFIIYDTELKTHINMNHMEIHNTLCKKKKRILGLFRNSDDTGYVFTSKYLFSNKDYAVYSFAYEYKDYQVVHMSDTVRIVYKGYVIGQIDNREVLGIYFVNNQWFAIIKEYGMGVIKYIIGNDKVMTNYTQKYGSIPKIDYRVVGTLKRDEKQIKQEIMLEYGEETFIRVANLLDSHDLNWYNKYNKEVKKLDSQKNTSKYSDYIMNYLKIKEPILNCQRTLEQICEEFQPIIDQYKIQFKAFEQSVKIYDNKNYDMLTSLDIAQGFLEMFNYILSIKMKDIIVRLKDELCVLDVQLNTEDIIGEKEKFIVYPSVIVPDKYGMSVIQHKLPDIVLLEKEITF